MIIEDKELLNALFPIPLRIRIKHHINKILHFSYERTPKGDCIIEYLRKVALEPGTRLPAYDDELGIFTLGIDRDVAAFDFLIHAYEQGIIDTLF